ncbi:MAG TPA: hypothetical protein PLT66_08050, partial [Bacillota bacterium]|nr:hypothetical protein [Bacillota bacterium]
IGYQCVFAYAISLMVYQFGSVFTGNLNAIGFIAAILVFALMFYMLFIRKYYEAKAPTKTVKVD